MNKKSWSIYYSTGDKELNLTFFWGGKLTLNKAMGLIGKTERNSPTCYLIKFTILLMIFYGLMCISYSKYGANEKLLPDATYVYILMDCKVFVSICDLISKLQMFWRLRVRANGFPYVADPIFKSCLP